MASVTVLRYGNVLILNCHTRAHEVTVKYDPSDTDRLYLNLRLVVAGFLVPGGESLASYYSVDQIAQQAEQGGIALLGQPIGKYDLPLLIAELNKPRRWLEYFVIERVRDQQNQIQHNLYPIWAVMPMTEFPAVTALSTRKPDTVVLEVANGPKPRGVRVEQYFPATGIAKVEFTVEASVLAVPFGKSFADLATEKPDFDLHRWGGEINNRWTIEESMDENFYTTRRIAGRITVAGTAFVDHILRKQHGQILPQLRRYLAFPLLERSFVRQSITYRSSEDGLSCDYEIVDVQVAECPPWPATSMTGRVELMIDEAFTCRLAANFQLGGPPHVDRKLLIQLAFKIIESVTLGSWDKLNDEKANCFLDSARITTYYGQRQAVDVAVTIRMLPAGIDADGKAQQPGDWMTNFQKTYIGRPIDFAVRFKKNRQIRYDKSAGSLPGLFGFTHDGERSPAALILLSCYLQEPERHHDLPMAATSKPRIEKVRLAKQDEPEDTTETPGTEEGDVDESKHSVVLYTPQTMYTFAALRSTYYVDSYQVGLPRSVKDKDGRTTLFTTLAEPAVYRVIEFETERIGGWPKIPAAPESYDVTDKCKAYLVWKQLTPHAPSPTKDARQLAYKVSGTYVYQLEAPPPALDVGMLPMTSPQQLRDQSGRITAALEESTTLTGISVEDRYSPE
ncbi:MAG: hypothetical protein H5U08_09735 [Thermogutta sp.]|uniref:hypothetical protein n=1 Tax=Thermogutta sp. TaxID=1962930 RepID=UPI0019A7D9F3|nr:hypothetical protein [Thermogutta sp.]MBC7352626.1 hypothetical protein [Thermogutta sp.]